MKIKTLKDWKRYKFKQHPLFYLFILFFILDFSIFIVLESEVENDYYLEGVTSANINLLTEISNVILPVVIIAQLTIIFWISIEYKKHINNKLFPYNVDLIWLLWAVLGLTGFYYFLFLSPQEGIFHASMVLAALYSFLSGQWFLYRFWRKYLWASFYIICPNCMKKNYIDSLWFDFSKEKYTIHDEKCYSVKKN